MVVEYGACTLHVAHRVSGLPDLCRMLKYVTQYMAKTSVTFQAGLLLFCMLQAKLIKVALEDAFFKLKSHFQGKSSR